jgi:uncharacterized protein YdiU (UPF0061 family)
VFSSIDRTGRYAYVNQPAIAQWNLARFAETLLPLIDADSQKAVSLATAAIDGFIEQFETRFLDWLCRKIGLGTVMEGDADLVNRLLAAMQSAEADFTLTFRRLYEAMREQGEDSALRAMFSDAATIDQWLVDWRARVARDSRSLEERGESMRTASPAFIPRNHRVELALDAATERGDLAPFDRLLAIVQHPYDDQPDATGFSRPPEPSERVLQTFCGT